MKRGEVGRRFAMKANRNDTGDNERKKGGHERQPFPFVTCPCNLRFLPSPISGQVIEDNVR